MQRSSDPFVTFVEDLFRELGPVQCRAMFGGYGVYFRGRMFALIAEDRLYMKTDADLARDYEDSGSEPFVYHTDRKAIQMSYWSMPEDALEQPALARRWADRSLEVAAKAAKKKAGRTSKKSKASKTGPKSASKKSTDQSKAGSSVKQPLAARKSLFKAKKSGKKTGKPKK
ncbi:MAG TPA: competence protein TfoX [Leptospiraceae bacterium]|nr:competence protein TfoX [Spirochaetaceae bacterium]HBS06065.1 competence protein TfoX [Leptospiraceae bacterium]